MSVTTVYLVLVICLPYTHVWKENEEDYLDNPIYEHFSLEPKYWEEATVYMNISHQTQSPTPKYNLVQKQWITQSVQDIAFTLRGHKFGDFDRRIYKADDRNSSVKLFYRQFPTPPLRHLHQKVRHVCEESLLDCVTYLQKVAHHTQFVRQDFPGTVTFNELKNTTVTDEEIAASVKTCILHERSDFINALPFRGPLDRFQWRTTAAYYLCFFTINRLEEIKKFHEPCDNYASCLHPEFAIHNNDPRANDSIPFSCAMYSFCPDPCCPKNITSYEECWNDTSNPCYDIAPPEARECKLRPEENGDFTQMTKNHWNLTCNCQENGYVYKSMFGICVDIDECLLGTHTCDNKSESCFNVPGSFICGCHWGYFYDSISNRCIQHSFLKPSKFNIVKTSTERTFMQNIFNFLHPWSSPTSKDESKLIQ